MLQVRGGHYKALGEWAECLTSVTRIDTALYSIYSDQQDQEYIIYSWHGVFAVSA